MPNNNLLDLLAVLSLYKHAPGCRIGFPSASLAKIVYDGDLAVQTYHSLQKMRQAACNDIFCGIKWLPKKNDSGWRYRYDANLEEPRCYAHEIKEINKKGNDGKPKPKQYMNSPLVLLERQDTYIGKINKIPEDSCTVGRLHYFFTGCFHPSEIERQLRVLKNKTVDEIMDNLLVLRKGADKKETERLQKNGGDKKFNFGWTPSIPSNVTFQVNVTPNHRLKALMAISALQLFPTYVAKKRVVIDGNEGHRFILPLCGEPVSYEKFQLFHRHPRLGDFYKHRQFWVRAGVNAVAMFLKRKVGKDRYYEQV